MSSSKRVAVLSLWRDDVDRNLAGRIEHLLSKTYRPIRYIWVVGDSSDTTEHYLRAVARYRADMDIRVIRHDTFIEGDDPDTRLARMGRTADAGIEDLKHGDGYLLLHESDLITPDDIIQRFMATGKLPIAGWPMLGGIFYDTYAYRKNGQMFSNNLPFHECYRSDEPFEVDGFGSCWLADAEDFVAGVRGGDGGVVQICEQLRERGRTLWVDPAILIEQPVNLWVSREHARR